MLLYTFYKIMYNISEKTRHGSCTGSTFPREQSRERNGSEGETSNTNYDSVLYVDAVTSGFKANIQSRALGMAWSRPSTERVIHENI